MSTAKHDTEEKTERLGPPDSGPAQDSPTEGQHPSSSMRDGAMARTAPHRDLAARRGQAARRAQAEGSGDTSSGTGADRSGDRQGAPRRPPSGRRTTGPRRVRLTVQRIDPWSVFKISFLVSVALGIAGVVMVAVLWTVLSGMNVFGTLNEFIVQVTSGEDNASTFDLMNYVGFGRVVALAVVVGVVNVILLTALATLTAFLYNVCSALVGGAHLTLSDE